MTREEAIETIKEMTDTGRYIGSGSHIPLEVLESFKVAIEALKHDYDNGYRKGFEIATSLNRR